MKSATLFVRHQFAAIIDRLSYFPGVVLLGPRQVGKTTLARGVAAALTAATVDVPVDVRRDVPAPLFLDLEVEARIIQANVVNHTGATGWERMARPAIFDGEVIDGRRYLLVDDFVGQGGTLANLRGFILHHGGKVVGAITLTGRGDSAKLALTTKTLESLRNKHGRQAEIWWAETFGYGFDCLTESEARYLLRVEDADTIRVRISEARSEIHD